MFVAIEAFINSEQGQGKYAYASGRNIAFH